jgi:hypothetical protein
LIFCIFPGSQGKKLYVSGPPSTTRQSPSRTSFSDLSSDDSSKFAARLKIKKIMKDFVLGGEVTSHEQAMAAILECQQVLFHQNARNHLILVYPREVLVLDLDIGKYFFKHQIVKLWSRDFLRVT